jgi:hypothetical protein
LIINFPKWTNRIPALVAGGGGAGFLFAVCAVWYWFSPEYTDVGYAPEQPVAYSHKLHAGLLGIDCRYCHQLVEDGPHAMVPTSQTCMNCHATIRPDSPALEKVRAAHDPNHKDFGKPIRWIKVHLLPEYTYFDHSAHVRVGVGCVTCHGRIDQMETVRQSKPLSMSWCLECHRAQDHQLRPPDRVTDMEYVHDPALSLRLKQEHGIQPPTHCSGCHR